MRIAICTEISTLDKNKDIIECIPPGNEIFNLAMSESCNSPELTYLQTSLMSALLINMELVDYIIGGCGTGVGFYNSVLQYPNIICGHIKSPLDAFLFSSINKGNCVSLALNQEYGWAGIENLRMVFEQLFLSEHKEGYPEERIKSQRNSRKKLLQLSINNHRSMFEILKTIDKDIIDPIYRCKPFSDFILSSETTNELHKFIKDERG